ncbi:MAG TPA: molybdate ABC transporter substrate-binding protein [Candidatus Acidoferrales bacterium]|nr:molybdate ABC transporter substrate-binding protein [Candidatus Acidoferrales bacterium]
MNQKKHKAVLIRAFFLSAIANSFGIVPLPSTTAIFAAPSMEITVSAAISLKDVLNQIAQLYRAENPETVIHFNLGASGSLQLQIEQGAPVDIFISAAPKQMDALESEGLLLSGTRENLVKNEVVLIVPRGKTTISSFQDLTHPDVKLIAIGEPQAVPAGKYAQEILAHFGLYALLKPKFVEAQDVRQVLTFVETGNVDAGIVYRTDAMTSKQVTIVAAAPENSHSPVLYPVAVIKNSQNPSAAKAFVRFLLGAKAGAVFQKYGFLPANR